MGGVSLPPDPTGELDQKQKATQDVKKPLEEDMFVGIIGNNRKALCARKTSCCINSLGLCL
ncbi:hypothetical protein GH733_002117 [Mirounga leonina]|nr:hypothetical protein GH733_002117 [Mirounga leonina]